MTRTRKVSITKTEAQEQKALVEWMRYKGLLFFSIPNGANRSVYGHLHEKAMGLLPGATDLFLAMPTGSYSGYFIEMKRKGQKPRAEQEEFMVKVRAAGYKADWFDDWVKAKESIENYLYEGF